MAAVSPAGPEPMMMTRSMVALGSTRPLGVPVAPRVRGTKGEASVMGAWPQIPLEDTFGDCLRKAMRGVGVDGDALAKATGIDTHDIGHWLKDDGSATDTQARAIAHVLKLDPGSFAERALDAWAPPAIELGDVAHHPHDPHPSNGYVFFLEG